MNLADFGLAVTYSRFQPALLAAERVGVDDTILDIFGRLTDRYDIIDIVNDEIAAFERTEHKGDVLVPLTHPQYWTANVLYLCMAHAFRTRGYRPLVVGCYDSMPMCLRKFGDRDDRSTCTICHHDLEQWLEAFDIDPLYLSELRPETSGQFINDLDDINNVTHEGVDVAKFARSTTRKYLRKYRLNLDDEHERELYTRFLRTAVQLVDATRTVADEYDLSAIVGHHFGYLNGGTYLAAGRELGIPSICMAIGAHRQGTLYFGNVRNRRSSPAFSAEEDVRRHLATELTSQQTTEVEEYIQGRMAGESPAIHDHVSAANKSAVGSDDTTTVGMFTNLVWDASIIDSHVVFNNPYSWILTTIEAFSTYPDVELVVKPHPGEAVRASNDYMADWISTHINPLPENVTVLDPETDIDPYRMVDHIDVGIVYNSTLGVEMSYRGTPAIVLADAHYRGYGFTHDPETPQEYIGLLDDIDDVTLTEEMQRRARRYAHFFFCEKMVDIPLFDSLDAEEASPITHASIAPGSEGFDHIVEQILADSRTITRPSSRGTVEAKKPTD